MVGSFASIQWTQGSVVCLFVFFIEFCIMIGLVESESRKIRKINFLWVNQRLLSDCELLANTVITELLFQIQFLVS